MKIGIPINSRGHCCGRMHINKNIMLLKLRLEVRVLAEMLNVNSMEYKCKLDKWNVFKFE